MTEAVSGRLAQGLSDPRSGPIMVDANAFDGEERFRLLAESGQLDIRVSEGVRREASDGRTPPEIRAFILQCVVVPARTPTPAEHINRMRVRAILRGDAAEGRHAADAAHLCTAYEAGCLYYVTHDRRVLRRRGDLRTALPTLTIVTPARFLFIMDRFAASG